jgi:hypothetical protein
MSMRRMAYWWFWFVVSGRLIEKLLNFAMHEAARSVVAATRWIERRS